jgi:FAD/FMN-containing dehydrogenase
MSLKDDLQKIIAGEVEDDDAVLEKVARDASLFYVKPAVLVHPKDAHDISKVVQYINTNKSLDAQLSITARSAGTDMSGGPLNTSIILDMTAHFDHIGEVVEGGTKVDPGVFFRNFDKETKKSNLELPSYTASRELNTIGGMIANNSGGEKNLKN